MAGTLHIDNYSVTGNIVTANFALTWTARPSTGVVFIMNLPVATNRTASVTGYISGVGGITFTGTYAIVGGSMLSISSYTTTQCSIVTSQSAAAFSDPLQQSALSSAAGNLSGTITYEIAS